MKINTSTFGLGVLTFAITFALAFAFTLCPATSATAKEIEVTATGSGADEEWALMKALENAVRQTSSITIRRTSSMVSVDGETEVSEKTSASGDIKGGELLGKSLKGSAKGELTREGKETARLTPSDIDARYQGQILSYDVIKTEQKNGKYYTTVKAKVIKPDEYKGGKLRPAVSASAKYSLAIEPFSFYDEGKISCSSEKFSPDSIISGITGGLVRHIQQTGKFKVLERYDISGYDEEMTLIAAGVADPEAKNKLRKLIAADYLLQGDITDFSVSSTTSTIPLLGESTARTTAKVNVTYRLIETATMEILYTSSVSRRFTSTSKSNACGKATNNLLRTIPKEIADDIVKSVFPDFAPTKSPSLSKEQRERYEEAEDKCEESGDCDDLDAIEAELSRKASGAAGKGAGKGKERAKGKDGGANPPSRPIIKLPFDD